ncbi:MAG: hypothetical protein LBK22_05040 [Tannerella sp.]|jgi:hypothetical protein|nr:hypothetical protein [Tannerella sp.]
MIPESPFHSAADAFYDWQEFLAGAIEQNAGEWGIDLKLFQPVQDLRIEFKAACAVSMFTRTPEAIRDRIDTQAAYQTVFSAFLERYVIHNRAIGNSRRRELGLPLPDRKRGNSRAPSESAPAQNHSRHCH